MIYSIRKAWLPSLLFGLALGLAFAVPAYAADVVFDEDTTVTVNGSDYVILAGSEATSMDVAATTVTVTVPSGSTFTSQSLDRHVLNNNDGIAQTCTEDDNRLTITGSKTDVVITPDSSTLCTGDPAPPPSGGSSISISSVAVEDITANSARVRWNTSPATNNTRLVGAPAPADSEDTQTKTSHEAVLTNLSPDTLYSYRIEAGLPTGT